MITTKKFFITKPFSKNIGLMEEEHHNGTALMELEQYEKKNNLVIIMIETVFDPNKQGNTFVIGYKAFFKTK